MKRVFTVCAIVALLLFATTLVTEKASAVPQGKLTICHFDEDGVGHTIQIAAAAWPAHEAHLDLPEACPAVP